MIDDKNESVGVIPTVEALAMAQDRDLDLVEVSPNAKPPVAKLLDYGKYKYQQSRKERQGRKHQRASRSGELKIVRFTPVTSEHDIRTKVNRMEKFIQQGLRVKAVVRMRGRQRIYPELSAQLLSKVVDLLSGVAVVERPIIAEGPNQFAVTLISAKSAGAGDTGKNANENNRSRRR